MKNQARAAVVILALGGLVAASWTFARLTRSGSDALSGYPVRWELAVLCIGSMVGFALVYACCWSILLRSLEQRPLGRWDVIRLFLITWPGRYLPTSIAHYGGRFVAGSSLGAGRGVLAASFVYETLLTIAAAGGVSTVLLLAQSRESLSAGAWVAAAIAATAVALGVMYPGVSRPAMRLLARRVPRLAPVERHLLPTGPLLRAFCAYTFAAGLAGLAFWLAARALGEDVPPAMAVATYNLAGIAGMLAIVAPSGLGVREGVVVALLSGVVSPPVALAAALLARLAGVIADLLPLAAILVFDSGRRLIEVRRRKSTVDPVAALREAT